MWDAHGETIAWHTFASEQLFGVAFSPDGSLLASCSSTGRIRLHDRNGNQVGGWHAQSTITSVRFLPDGNRVATAGWNQLVQLWDLEGKEQHAWRGHLNGLKDVACSPDGRLASTSWDGTARIWSEHSLGCRIVTGIEGGVRRFAVAPDGSRVLAAGRRGDVVLTDVEGRVLWRRHLGADEPVAVAFASNGQQMLVAYADGALFQGEQEDPSLARIDTGLPLCGAAFLPGGEGIVAAAYTGIFGLALGGGNAAPATWPGTEETRPRRLQASSDGRLLVLVTEYDVVELWDPLQRRRITRVQGLGGVQNGVLSRDGRWLLIAAENGAGLWDVASGTGLRRYHGHQGGVLDAVFSPDPEHRYVLTASNDDTIRCFDRATGDQLAVLRGHRGGVTQLACSADGRSVISSSYDGTVRWWWLYPEEVLRAAEGLGIGEPTDAERQLVPALLR